MSIPENTTPKTHQVVWDLLREQNCKKVLDIPSGAGAFTDRVMRAGLDAYPADIENIMEVSNANFREADMNKRLPYEDGFFDAVVCIDGIEHLENPFLFVRESNRILRVGGVIIISTPNINSLRSRWRWFWTSHHNKDKSPLNEQKPTPLHHINMMSYQRMRYIFHTNGFRLTRVTTNRVKFISWIYAVFAPLSYLVTKWVFHREEKDPTQRRVNNEIVRDLFRAPLLFGETMIVMAEKK